MSRYDSRTTTFSPDGHLYQVEYAVKAIDNAGAAVGILAKDGVVIAGEYVPFWSLHSYAMRSCDMVAAIQMCEPVAVEL
jgi:hypothetical protein